MKNNRILAIAINNYDDEELDKPVVRFKRQAHA